MKKLFFLCTALSSLTTGFAQTDTTAKQNTTPHYDTIRVGGMIIIRKAGNNDSATLRHREYKMTNRKTGKPSNVSTNWWIFDLGFSNFTDNTDYRSSAAQAYTDPSVNKSWFELKNGKSRNVNIWIFMQKLNISKHAVNLKYGLGLELNNYFYKYPIRYNANPPAVADPSIISLDATANHTYKKDKLAADYLTVPMMVNFNFTPNRKKGFGFSAGISAGYLYSARNKTITSDEGKKKAKDNFDLQKWKLAYVAELALGPVHFYGNYALKSMYNRGLDMTPYTFGFRFSNW